MIQLYNKRISSIHACLSTIWSSHITKGISFLHACVSTVWSSHITKGISFLHSCLSTVWSSHTLTLFHNYIMYGRRNLFHPSLSTEGPIQIQYITYCIIKTFLPNYWRIKVYTSTPVPVDGKSSMLVIYMLSVCSEKDDKVKWLRHCTTLISELLQAWNLVSADASCLSLVSESGVSEGMKNWSYMLHKCVYTYTYRPHGRWKMVLWQILEKCRWH